MGIEGPQQGDGYRKELADKLNETRAQGGGFIKKTLGIDGRSKAENLLSEEKQSDEYKEEKAKKDKAFSENPQRLERKAGLKEIELKNMMLIDDLVKEDKWQYIIENLDTYFKGIDHNYIASKIIMNLQGSYVVHNLEKFKELDYEKIIVQLIETFQGESFDLNKKKFPLTRSQLKHYSDMYLQFDPDGIKWAKTPQGIEHYKKFPHKNNSYGDNYDAPRWPSDNKVPHRGLGARHPGHH